MLLYGIWVLGFACRCECAHYSNLRFISRNRNCICLLYINLGDDGELLPFNVYHTVIFDSISTLNLVYFNCGINLGRRRLLEGCLVSSCQCRTTLKVKAGFSRLYLSQFWNSSRMEIPQPLCDFLFFFFFAVQTISFAVTWKHCFASLHCALMRAVRFCLLHNAFSEIRSLFSFLLSFSGYPRSLTMRRPSPSKDSRRRTHTHHCITPSSKGLPYPAGLSDPFLDSPGCTAQEWGQGMGEPLPLQQQTPEMAGLVSS